MALCLVVHDLSMAGAEVMEAAVWELSESHWMVGTSMLVSTSVSPRYVTEHLVRALARAGLQGTVITTALSEHTGMAGVPEAGRLWMEEQLALLA